MSVYAIVKDGMVAEMALWDGESEWAPSEGTAVPATDGAGIGWGYIDGKFIEPQPPVKSREDLISEAAMMKKNLVDEAISATAIWRTELQLGIISDDDKAILTEWILYHRALQGIDVSAAPEIEWPVKPQSR